jgi:hypothetical protein
MFMRITIDAHRRWQNDDSTPSGWELGDGHVDNVPCNVRIYHCLMLSIKIRHKAAWSCKCDYSLCSAYEMLSSFFKQSQENATSVRIVPEYNLRFADGWRLTGRHATLNLFLARSLFSVVLATACQPRQSSKRLARLAIRISPTPAS